MDDVDRGVRKRQRLGRAHTDGDVGEIAGPAGGGGGEARVRLDADHAVRVGGEERQVETGAAAEVQDVRARPRADGAHRGDQHPSGSTARFSSS